MTFFAKNSIIDVCQDPKYGPDKIPLKCYIQRHNKKGCFTYAVLSHDL